VFLPGQVFVDGDSKVFPTINYHHKRHRASTKAGSSL
jgi:hypothetical protein